MGKLLVRFDAASASLGLTPNSLLLSLVQQSPRILRIIVGELSRQLLGARVHKKSELHVVGVAKDQRGPHLGVENSRVRHIMLIQVSCPAL
jgi:hypothetical protein